MIQSVLSMVPAENCSSLDDPWFLWAVWMLLVTAKTKLDFIPGILFASLVKDPEIPGKERSLNRDEETFR